MGCCRCLMRAPSALTDAINALVDMADTACRQAVPASAPATGILLRQVDR